MVGPLHIPQTEEIYIHVYLKYHLYSPIWGSPKNLRRTVVNLVWVNLSAGRTLCSRMFMQPLYSKGKYIVPVYIGQKLLCVNVHLYLYAFLTRGQHSHNVSANVMFWGWFFYRHCARMLILQQRLVKYHWIGFMAEIDQIRCNIW